MSSVLVDHHNRLGDHLMCNGLVREYAKRHDRVGLFTIPTFEPFVRFMFRDLPNLEIVIVHTHRDKTFFRIKNFLTFGSGHYDEIRKIWDVDFETGIPSEYQFYKLADVPYVKKWDSFHVERDRDAERILEAKLSLPSQYVFVHDDGRYPINDELVTSPLPKFRVGPGLTDNLFDYSGIIERAEEVHVIDSSFMFLIDCMKYKAPGQKLFVHRYARPNAAWNLPVLRKPWVVLS
ncbi:MAG: hypothetical protein AAB472_03435 [Patescibacteria group bacterium]